MCSEVIQRVLKHTSPPQSTHMARMMNC